jgi:hypothetical protein
VVALYSEGGNDQSIRKKKKLKRKKGDNDNGDREQLINDKKIEIIR